jgi:inosose dehydratase
MSHWKTVPFRQIDNFRDFYYEDRSNSCYFLDWDRILRYHRATGYDGIELAPWDLAEILGLFGTPAEYTAFVRDHGMELFTQIFAPEIKERQAKQPVWA